RLRIAFLRECLFAWRITEARGAAGGQCCSGFGRRAPCGSVKAALTLLHPCAWSLFGGGTLDLSPVRGGRGDAVKPCLCRTDPIRCASAKCSRARAQSTLRAPRRRRQRLRGSATQIAVYLPTFSCSRAPRGPLLCPIEWPAWCRRPAICRAWSIA